DQLLQRRVGTQRGRRCRHWLPGQPGEGRHCGYRQRLPEECTSRMDHCCTSEAGQPGAFVPQATGEVAVERRRVRLGWAFADDIAAVETLGVGHRGEKHRCLGTLLWAE